LWDEFEQGAFMGTFSFPKGFTPIATNDRMVAGLQLDTNGAHLLRLLVVAK